MRLPAAAPPPSADGTRTNSKTVTFEQRTKRDQVLFELLCEHGGPEQKVIIFCTREIHADRVSQHMNNLYVRWCKERGHTPKDHYCARRPNFDHPCRLNIDQGWKPVSFEASCG